MILKKVAKIVKLPRNREFSLLRNFLKDLYLHSTTVCSTHSSNFSTISNAGESERAHAPFEIFQGSLSKKVLPTVGKVTLSTLQRYAACIQVTFQLSLMRGSLREPMPPSEFSQGSLSKWCLESNRQSGLNSGLFSSPKGTAVAFTRNTCLQTGDQIGSTKC